MSTRCMGKARAALALAAAASAAGRGLPAQSSAALTRGAAVVERAAAEIDGKYVDSVLARAMADTLRARVRRGAYRSVADLRALCDTLNAQLQRLSRDPHLRLVYSSESLAVDPPSVRTDDARERDFMMARVQAEGRTRNFGFDQVTRLPGNIGYVRLSTFFPLPHGRDVADAAMRLLANTDAVILDLRGNSGGAPDMMGHLMRYFITEPLVTGTRYNRLTGRLTTDTLLPIEGSGWFRGKPTYVLLDGGIFSAPEAFAYTLQAFGRVVVVGERTRGGAHLTSGWQIDPHIGIRIPHARSWNARTGTDWEGTGVVPDIPAAGPRAHLVAQIAALRELLHRDPGAGELTDERRAALARLEQALTGGR